MNWTKITRRIKRRGRKKYYKTIDILNVLTCNEIVCNKCEYEISVCRNCMVEKLN